MYIHKILEEGLINDACKYLHTMNLMLSVISFA